MEKKEFFPQCAEPGSVTNLNTGLMHQMSQSSVPISNELFDQIYKDHKEFIESGGRGGRWQSIEVSGLTLGVYTGAKASLGKQASFLNSNLSNLDLQEKNLESADFVNVYYPNGSFRNSNLSNCIFIDSVLDHVDFTGSDLSGTDFSRSSMKSCRFNDANLSGCDFENCDLSNSTFVGAKTSGARFPGANLENVVY